jgi:hypothetical protein
MNRTIHGQHEKTEESLSEMHIYANRKTVKKKKKAQKSQTEQQLLVPRNPHRPFKHIHRKPLVLLGFRWGVVS